MCQLLSLKHRTCEMVGLPTNSTWRKVLFTYRAYMLGIEATHPSQLWKTAWLRWLHIDEPCGLGMLRTKMQEHTLPVDNPLIDCALFYSFAGYPMDNLVTQGEEGRKLLEAHQWLNETYSKWDQAVFLEEVDEEPTFSFDLALA